ncbi:MAG: hypothetical protein IRY85_10765 [Micromonosporaceae bacterium]|nr:hypothetical protein [Micromonosporaceae bacterium]
MRNEMKIDALGEHRFLVRTRQDDDVVEVLVRASPAAVARFIDNEADEIRVIEATFAYLLTRQRADDLPPQLDLDEVLAAYADLEDDVRRRLQGAT